MSMHKPFILGLVLLFSMGCGKEERPIPETHETRALELNKKFFKRVGSVHPYNHNTAYSKELQKCVYAYDANSSCTLEELPLLGMEYEEITIERIMERTMVSHDFLGTRFKEILKRLPKETLTMFGAVNAVVISDRINPSFYTSTSGAIYLSGHYFWSNSEEKELTTKVKDDRNDYASELGFTHTDDYLKNHESIYTYSKTRDLDDIFLPLAKLLFHELAHANDYFTKNFYSNMDQSDRNKTYSALGSFRYRYYHILSDGFSISPTSKKLKQLAQVMFFGEKATPEDKAMTAKDVLNEFLSEVATDLYSYSDPLEDLAMLVEESLMLHYFDAHRSVVFISYPQANFRVPKDYDYPIAGGIIRAVTSDRIKERALYGVKHTVGYEVSAEVRKTLNKLQPKEIPAGISWEELDKL